ncbi:hypothetical protein GB931_21430 [Modestobacter sp. I12A-02628]|uniref:Uncharacterized protein n=1 Tax=Goekera deserti TaxID=2497753 RepID=A0A7K3W981_9ACTN|nr:hypothetical protein [Goekera deserti]MPR00437.1 hypothetical protein [Goekera deserti]NDI49166.1 hypothetical protein [Goekera deserti]NEL52904.1 hypothetical protein [Goekera deserti]
MSHAALETDLPARAHHLPAAGVVVVSVALLALAPEQFGDAGRLAAVLALQLLLVAAWVTATGIRGFVGSLGIGAAAAISADLLMVLPEEPRLDGLLVVLGAGFLVMVVHQMLRPAPRRYLVASLAGVVLLVCAVCALSFLLTLGRVDDGPRAVTTAVLAAGAALLAGHLVDLVLPRPTLADGVPRGLLGLLLAVLAAVGVLVLRQQPDGLEEQLSAGTAGAVLGVVTALMAVGASYVVAERPQRGWALPVVQAVLPLAAVAPIAYSVALQVPL